MNLLTALLSSDALSPARPARWFARLHRWEPLAAVLAVTALVLGLGWLVLTVGILIVTGGQP